MTNTVERHRARQPGNQWPRPSAARPKTGPNQAGHGLGGFIRRHKLAPFLLLAPALAGIAGVPLWPLAQIVTYSFQNFGLPQLTGAEPTQWVGF